MYSSPKEKLEWHQRQHLQLCAVIQWIMCVQCTEASEPFPVLPRASRVFQPCPYLGTRQHAESWTSHPACTFNKHGVFSSLGGYWNLKSTGFQKMRVRPRMTLLVLRLGLTVWPWLAWSLLCRPHWRWTHRDPPASVPECWDERCAVTENTWRQQTNDLQSQFWWVFAKY